jgi:Schlafen, AlbA_2
MFRTLSQSEPIGFRSENMEIWDEARLRSYIDNFIEESLVLDYKAANSLGQSDRKKMEVTKDVSAMANSAGGTIIYGLKECAEPEKKTFGPKR